VHALVVDDSRAMRSILTRILGEAGFDTISQAGDGQEALNVLAASANLPDIALVDWNMPVMDGLTFVSECRSNPEYRRMTLMMVTTESEQGQIVRALAAGAHEYVIKPFTADAIVDKLEILGITATQV
jgi:two-component system, chemotaxis family, chemotaxis protein CheY